MGYYVNFIEKIVAMSVIVSALDQGYTVSVYDCEQITLLRSNDAPAILAAMQTTDDDRLYFHKTGSNKQAGLFLSKDSYTEELAETLELTDPEDEDSDVIAPRDYVG